MASYGFVYKAGAKARGIGFEEEQSQTLKTDGGAAWSMIRW